MPTKHRFDGIWSYFQTRDVGFPPAPLIPEQADLDIPDNTKEDVKGRTIHGFTIVSGKADLGEKTLKLTATGPGTRREYEGERVQPKDFPGGVERVLLIIGRFKDFPVPLSPADQARGVKALVQEEGTWVIIK